MVGKRENAGYLADDKLNVNLLMKYDFFKGRKCIGKKEIAGYQHFLFFPRNVFKRPHLDGREKVRIVH